MLPSTDFALRCENPIGLPRMGGREIDTPVFEYLNSSIGYISFAGAGRAGYSAHTIASTREGLQVEISGNLLRAVSATGLLDHLTFDAESGLLAVKWAAGSVVFAGRCAIEPAPLYFIRMPKRIP